MLLFQFIFKFLSRVPNLLLNYNSVFKPCQIISCLVTFLLLVEFILIPIATFEFLFSNWMMNILEFSHNFWKLKWALYSLLKNEMGFLVAIEKLQEHKKGALHKWVEVYTQLHNVLILYCRTLFNLELKILLYMAFDINLMYIITFVQCTPISTESCRRWRLCTVGTSSFV